MIDDTYLQRALSTSPKSVEKLNFRLKCSSGGTKSMGWWQ